MHRLLGWIVALVILLPTPSLALTEAETTAQLQALSAQIAALTAQLTQLTAPSAQIAPQTSAQCPQLSRNLTRGARGPDVAQLQQFLVSKKVLSADSATGFFGPLTENAVKAWQTEAQIIYLGTPATTGFGAVGPLTRQRIAQSCSGAVPNSIAITIDLGTSAVNIPAPTVSAPVTQTYTYTYTPTMPVTASAATAATPTPPATPQLTLAEKVAQWSCPSPMVAANSDYRLYSYDAARAALYLNSASDSAVSQVMPPPPPTFPSTLPQGGARVLTRDMSDQDVRAHIDYASGLLTQYWTSVFAAMGRHYIPPSVVVTTDASQAGDIYYLPGTRTVHLNSYYFHTQVPTASYRDAGTSYIYQTLAHEVGHHVFHQMGLWDAYYAAKQVAATPAKANAINACSEIQADFLAGVSLRGANLLQAGEPDYIYYGSTSDANDTNTARAGLSFNPADYTHGTAKQMSGAIFEGMRAGNYTQALNLLSGIGVATQ